MKEVVVHETHYITHDDHPELALPMTVDVAYRVLDDGFCIQEILPETIDYPCQGSC